jgi:antitoxin MazE
MLLDVVRIGNSKGIRLPAVILKECNITDKVEMEVKDGRIIIVPSEGPRKDWDIKFKEMNAAGDDKLLIAEEELSENLEDWEW